MNYAKACRLSACIVCQSLCKCGCEGEFEINACKFVSAARMAEVAGAAAGSEKGST